MFNELYILPPNEANAQRQSMNIYKDNKIVDQILMELDAMLRDCNPLAQAFMTTHAQYLDAVEEARLNNQDKLPSFTMVLLDDRSKDPGVHPHRLAPFNANEVCAIYRSPYGEPLQGLPHGQWIRCSDTKKLRKIPFYHPNKNALSYPLLLPYGQQTYKDGILLIRKKPTSRVADAPVDADHQQMHDGCDGDRPRPRKKGPASFASRRDFLQYLLQLRHDPKTIDPKFPLWACRLLAQKFIIDNVWEIERQEAYMQKQHQQNLRRILHKDFIAALENGLQPGQKLGNVFLLRTRAHFAIYSKTTTTPSLSLAKLVLRPSSSPLRPIHRGLK
jgi:hypothetical protein